MSYSRNVFHAHSIIKVVITEHQTKVCKIKLHAKCPQNLNKDEPLRLFLLPKTRYSFQKCLLFKTGCLPQPIIYLSLIYYAFGKSCSSHNSTHWWKPPPLLLRFAKLQVINFAETVYANQLVPRTDDTAQQGTFMDLCLMDAHFALSVTVSHRPCMARLQYSMLFRKSIVVMFHIREQPKWPIEKHKRLHERFGWNIASIEPFRILTPILFSNCAQLAAKCPANNDRFLLHYMA